MGCDQLGLARDHGTRVRLGLRIGKIEKLTELLDQAMSRFQLAQLNIARLLAPVDSPQLAEFVARLAEINALADAAPGFVWRFQTEDGDATALRPYDDDEIIINYSVWESPEALRAYVYQGSHAEVMKRRREWFSRMSQPYMVLWWVPAGHRPTMTEAKERLELLRQEGPTREAFSFRQIFPAPDASMDETPRELLDQCPT